MLVIKKKQIIAAVLVLMLITAGYLNFIYMDSKGDKLAAALKQENIGSEPENYGEAKFVGVTEESDYFKETALNKEKSRAEQLDILNGVANSETSTPEAKQEAQQCIIEIAKNIERESSVENILAGKGYPSVSAYISDETLTVAVGGKKLTDEDVACISDAAAGASGLSAEQIKIMEIN